MHTVQRGGAPATTPQYTPQRVLYRTYRQLKVHFLDRAPLSLMGRAFFFGIGQMDRFLSPRIRPTREQMLADQAFRDVYARRFGDRPRYRVVTERPVAVDSHDHQHPRGTIFDSSVNRRFNRAAARFLGAPPNLRLLDLGCAGGGLVRSMIEDGFEAVGVEGSDASRRARTGEWPNCPLHLFTADLTHPFQIVDAAGEAVRFDVITAWEVLEHIAVERLATLFDNILRHLSPNGIFVGSVDQLPDGDPISGAVYHVTLHDRPWWVAQAAASGLREVVDHPFQPEDYVRGNGLTLKDWDPRDGDGFHLVLRRA